MTTGGRGPAAPDPTAVADAARIARRISEQKPEIVQAMSELLAREIDRLDEDPQLVEMLTASVESNVSTVLHVLTNDITLEHLSPATAAVEYAHRLAQREVSSHSLVRAYHMGQDYLLGVVFSEVEQAELSAGRAMAVLRYISEIAYRYIDWITLYVFEAYESERRRWMGARGNVHSTTIHGLLAGAGTTEATFEAETRYRLGRIHVAVILWSTDVAHAPALHHLADHVTAMARALCADGDPIITAVDRDTLWGWLPFERRRPAVDIAALRRSIPPDADIHAAVGLPAYGVAGFRRTHQQALAAVSVVSLPGAAQQHVIGYGDRGIAVMALLTENLDSTRAWVREVLGPLAEDTSSAAALRETLRVYFDTGDSAVRTAERLYLHRNTVKYRITKTLDEPESAVRLHSRLDVALALEACATLGPTVLGGD